MAVGRFLCAVIVLVRHPFEDRYLLLQRSPQKDYMPNAWECVTGRVDQGESFDNAVYREVYEEIGLDVEVEAILGTSHFYRGEWIPENEIQGLKYLARATADAVVIGEEHSQYGWLTVPEIQTMLPSDHWLQDLIQRAEQLRALVRADAIRPIFGN
ncbi:MAG: NUDIX domain-containing protein [Anaerolineae bacterium]|jgi:8-oxo-dGTP diphosphatase|nr:NUDIX domain-containing protein [Anaerolineae bacterium]